MQPLRILFIGTGEFAVPILQKLQTLPDVEIVGIVTQPDKPVGREQQIEGGPLKRYLDSQNQGVPYALFQPEKLKAESQHIMEQTTPDLVIVAAYGQMIPADMLSLPKFGAINLHGSLLPKLRGAVPVPVAILQGLNETGVTIQKMVKELDAGPVYISEPTAVLVTDTTASLKLRLAERGAELLTELLPRLARDDIKLSDQDDATATFCYQADIAKEKAEITGQTPVVVAERMVRAFYPWPVAWFTVGPEHKRVKVFSAGIPAERLPQAQDEILEVVRMGKRLFLLLNDGALELKEVQMESKNRRPAEDYLFLASRSIAPVD